MSLFRTKPISTDAEQNTGLRRCLTALDLTLLGVGAIIGAGIFVLTGIAAATQAGPAIVLSYVLAGFACVFSALSYAELSASIGGCGSAYGYAYAGFGEIIAWIIGWDLILEYSVAVSAVAIGWSGYVSNGLSALGVNLPTALLNGPWQGGIINLPAVLVIVFLTYILSIGVHSSARFNAWMVAAKLFAIAVFLGVAIFNIDPTNWHPFMPFGWEGVAKGAALIFFAYIGFDAVSTAAEEVVNPKKNLPIGIIASLAICTLVYVIVAGALTGVASYTTLNVASPVSDVLLKLGHRAASGIIAVGAIAGLTTVMLVMFYGLTRVFLAMSRDGLLPPVFSALNQRTQTPARIIIIAGIIMALIAGLAPMGHVAELVNIGTLFAFILVCGGVIVLRHTRPEMLRPFKVPFSPIVPFLGIATCAYLIMNLGVTTWIRFAVWMLLGFIIYFWYSKKNSVLEKGVAVK